MLLVAGFFASVTPAASQALPAPGGSTSFQPAPCPFSAAETAPYHITCGTVAVIENRAHDDGRRVKLAVAVVHAQSAHPEPDPVVFLDGGPGQSSMSLVVLRLRGSLRVREILKTRDYIFWDQRGVGRSEPHLCTALDTAWFSNALLGFSVDEQRRRNLETLHACRHALEETQTDIAQFGTATSAADLEDLRRALGIHIWNLDGGSYGTRLALVAMRDAPTAIRSVVLDGVVPIDAEEYSANAWRFARVVELLAARCAEDAGCHARFPKLAARLYQLIAALKQRPFVVPVTPGPTFPGDHIVVNDRVLAAGLFQAFYNTELIPLLPAVIEQIEHGNGATFEAMASSLLSNLAAIRQSLNIAVDCHDAMPLTSFAAIRAANAAFPRLGDAFADDESFPAYCADWNPNGAHPEELLPTLSSVPTLMLVGDFDPVTPPAYAHHALATLTASTVLELPSAGHGGKSRLKCVADVEVAFLSNPGGPLNLACAANFARVPFLTEYLLLPGLTRLLLGLQTHSHLGLVVLTGLAILLPILCLVGISGGALYRRWRPRHTSAAQSATPRTLILAASLSALGTAALLAYNVKLAFDSNPNLLLLGLPGRPLGLMSVAVLAGILSVVVLVACLRRIGPVWRLPLIWLGSAGAVAYLCTLVGLIFR